MPSITSVNDRFGHVPVDRPHGLLDLAHEGRRARALASDHEVDRGLAERA
jgi:hypothetical protein